MKDRVVQHMCDDLRKMREGLAAFGVQAHNLASITQKLKDQAERIEQMQSTSLYIAGRKDGWNAAMESGLAGEKE